MCKIQNDQQTRLLDSKSSKPEIVLMHAETYYHVNFYLQFCMDEFSIHESKARFFILQKLSVFFGLLILRFYFDRISNINIEYNFRTLVGLLRF